MDGGISGLVRLSRTHRAELEYDCRTRLRFPLSEVGVSVPADEAARLVGLLVKDPTSQVGAAVQGLAWAPSREWLLLADLYDAFVTRNFQRPKLYPRPWVSEKDSKRLGDTAGRTPAQIKAILARFGHGQPDVKEAPHG